MRDAIRNHPRSSESDDKDEKFDRFDRDIFIARADRLWKLIPTLHKSWIASSEYKSTFRARGSLRRIFKCRYNLRTLVIDIIDLGCAVTNLAWRITTVT